MYACMCTRARAEQVCRACVLTIVLIVRLKWWCTVYKRVKLLCLRGVLCNESMFEMMSCNIAFAFVYAYTSAFWMAVSCSMRPGSLLRNAL
jgi:hypothetical protein